MRQWEQVIYSSICWSDAVFAVLFFFLLWCAVYFVMVFYSCWQSQVVCNSRSSRRLHASTSELKRQFCVFMSHWSVKVSGACRIALANASCCVRRPYKYTKKQTKSSCRLCFMSVYCVCVILCVQSVCVCEQEYIHLTHHRNVFEP